MLTIKVIMYILSGVFVLDYYLAFGDANAGGVTSGLCRPCFSLFYPKLGMKTGALIWLLEYSFILFTIFIWLV